MDRKKLIKNYLNFLKSKNHQQIANASLIPENDPTVLFTTAGMHPIVPYLLGQPHPLGKRLCNVQRCIRTGDIEEVGDTTHHTFFEMLGKWSIGDYFKKQAIEYTFEYFTKILKIPLEKLAVSCFKGNKNVAKDNESAKIWNSLGIPKERIAFLPKKDNWWETPGPGPCGPDTEIFYWKDNSKTAPKKFNPEDSNWVEIGNDVLMQYKKETSGKYKEAKQKNIDFGGGVERITTILNKLEDNYLGDTFKLIIQTIEKISGKKYGREKNQTRSMRIIADHIKASCFIIADGISPGNTEQSYVLRKLIRKAARHGKKLEIKNFTAKVAEPVFKIYDDYKHLQKNKKQIIEKLNQEEEKFNLTLEKGLKIFAKIAKNKKEINCNDAFLLYQSYGFPIEITKELTEEKGIKIDLKGFQKKLQKHQELSRTATAGKFKSGLANNSKETTNLHTATHLLLAALRTILKDKNILQKGSNITPERLRLDFSFPRKISKEELKKIEDLVNAQIQKSHEIIREEMSPEQAKKKGALGVFDAKYKDKVSVYTIGEFSKEICAGPHATNTKELGHFKIKKEESSSQGVRRIKAILE